MCSKCTVAVSVVTWVGKKLAQMVLLGFDSTLILLGRVRKSYNQAKSRNQVIALYYYTCMLLLHRLWSTIYVFFSISVTKQAMIWLLLHHTGVVTNAICLNFLFLISPLLGINPKRQPNRTRLWPCLMTNSCPATTLGGSGHVGRVNAGQGHQGLHQVGKNSSLAARWRFGRGRRSSSRFF